MCNLKYDGRMEEFPAAWHLSPQDAANVDFRLERLNPQTWQERRFADAFAVVKGPLLWLAQRLAPRLKWGRLLILTRDADVRAVLADREHFRVHYDPEMCELCNGDTFMLALDDKLHKKAREKLEPICLRFPPTASRSRAKQVAEDLLVACNGRIDVMKDYFCRVSAEAAITYLGLAVGDADNFADCTLAMSTMIFGDPFGKPEVRELASHAAWRLRSIADRAIALAKRKQGSGLVQALVDSAAFSDGEIRAIVLGLSTALIPTNTLAAGNMLLYLLSNRDAWQQAVDAAHGKGRHTLREVLLEAGRLKPALNPGQFRYMPEAAPLPRGGRVYPQGTVVLLATATALRDRHRFNDPRGFRPGRPDHKDATSDRDPLFDGGLMFGDGDHACFGKQQAIDEITEVFRLLLTRPGLKRATGADSAIKSAGLFSRRLDMVFDQERHLGEQAMVKIAVYCPGLGNVADTTSEVIAARAAVARLGNPARAPELCNALDKAGIIHFASMNLIDVGSCDRGRYLLLLEVNADGTAAAAVKCFCAVLGTELLHILELCGHVSRLGEALDTQNLVLFLLDRRLDVHARPWGTTGLDYNGSSEFALPVVEEEKNLADFAARAVDLYERLSGQAGKRPMIALQFVRALIQQDEQTWPARRARALAGRYELETIFDELEALGRQFRQALVLPSRHRLAFADWQEVGVWTKIWNTVTSPGLLRLIATGLIISATLGLLLGSGIGPVPPSLWEHYPGIVISTERRPGGSGWPHLGLVAAGWQWHQLGPWLSWLLVRLLVGLLSVLGLAGATIASMYGLLRVKENADRPDDRDPDVGEREKIAALENPYGFEQNHFISVSDFKPGLFRWMVYAFALYGVGVYVRYWTRPGFIQGMGTIHFAGWLRPPGTDKLVFLANYDGSWESYLEDFVTRANTGQTAVWSNALGFPRARGLIFAGANEGDRFKRWVRRQQRPSQFWYSRWPKLTLDRMRANALIHAGLARAGSETEARAWLNCFGSQPPMENTVETDEVQSIVFTSMPTHPFAACLIIKLPEDVSSRHSFLSELLTSGVHTLPQLGFGDLPPGSRCDTVVSYLALSAGGLRKCGLPDIEAADGLASFGFPFVAGMAARSPVLRDAELSEPSLWRWNDKSVVGAAVHAALWLVAVDENERDTAVANVKKCLASLGGTTLRTMPTRPVGTEFGQGHFGFSDGHSQPIIRGTTGARAALDRDLIQPGEFLFGYQNNQGFVPPSPRLQTELDPECLLAETSFDRSQRYPSFRPERQLPAFRDFGRNGSYLVLRELEQNADGFHNANTRHASDLKTRYPGLEAAPGIPITAEWVAAKLVGRWPDGTPLVDRIAPPPKSPSATSAPVANNDFDYGKDDPSGLKCPLGAHVRRANPRDSLNPGDSHALSTTNRHRLIRRSRSYTYPTDDVGKQEKGLLFTAICGDLERQFEFVQQRWIASPIFHGLASEGDPLLAAPQAPTGVFTVPTRNGPIQLQGLQSYVTVRGGGYFFLPSRSALQFLAELDHSKLSAA